MKYYGNTIDNNHYLNSLVQDALAVVDSFSKRSERYYNFILRSYIENFLRLLLELEDNDAMGIMKLFGKCSKLIKKVDGAIPIFEKIENQYGDCCLFVHSNINASTEVNVYLKKVLQRNDFEESSKINSHLKQFESLLDNSIKLIILCKSASVDNTFYRKKDILKKLISTENYNLFLKAINE